MGKVTWEFDTDTERNEIALHHMAGGMHSVLWQMRESLYKHHGVAADADHDVVFEVLSDICDEFQDFLDDCNVKLERVQ